MPPSPVPESTGHAPTANPTALRARTRTPCATRRDLRSSNPVAQAAPVQRKPVLPLVLSGELCVRAATRSGCSSSRGRGRTRRATPCRPRGPRPGGRPGARGAGTLDGPPVRAPLPEVAGHVVEPEAVGPVGVGRCGAAKAVLGGVPGGKMSLPDVATVPTTGGELVAPRVTASYRSPSGRVLPFDLCGQPQPRPVAVGGSVVPGHLHHRMLLAAARRTAGPFGAAQHALSTPHRAGCSVVRCSAGVLFAALTEKRPYCKGLNQ